jgi:hypothetical protein
VRYPKQTAQIICAHHQELMSQDNPNDKRRTEQIDHDPDEMKDRIRFWLDSMHTDIDMDEKTPRH